MKDFKIKFNSSEFGAFKLIMVEITSENIFKAYPIEYLVMRDFFERNAFKFLLSNDDKYTLKLRYVEVYALLRLLQITTFDSLSYEYHITLEIIEKISLFITNNTVQTTKLMLI